MDTSNSNSDFPTGCAILFGANGGIGQAIAELLSRQGVNLVLCYRSNPEKRMRWLSGLKNSAIKPLLPAAM
ncbi:MAG: hypothetical protein R3E73_06080 [Porticoccaceae bacterium]